MEAQWTVATEEARIEDRILTVKVEGHQLAVGRDDSGELFAIDNRCPHEGYPLAQGEVKGCLLTCAWHNWKFDVRDGSCVLGGEAVRHYPVRVQSGMVEVDLAEPDPAEKIPQLRESFRQGVHRYENGRAIRDGVRLIQAGYPAAELLADLAAYDGRHAEYGSTHVLALAADALAYLPRFASEEAMYPVAQVVDLCGESNRRLPPRPRPEAVEGELDQLEAAVEAEDAERAEGLVRTALARGAALAEVDRWMLRAMASHFTDFGHQLIYLQKLPPLLEAAGLDGGDERVADIYGGLVYGTVLGTREDTLPYMKAYFEQFDRQIEDPALLTTVEAAPFDAAGLREAVLDGTATDSVSRLVEALRSGVAPARIARTLAEAAAERLLRFDPAHDGNPDVAEGWLWATHRLTFASGVRKILESSAEPAAIRLLAQVVAFTHSGRRMDRDDPTAVPGRPGTVEEVMKAVEERRREDAVALTAGVLDDGQAVEELLTRLSDHCLTDPLVRPIFACHLVKTMLAAADEYRALGPESGRTAVLGAVRFLAASVGERTVHRTVRTSIRFIRDGVMPRKLTQ